MKKIVLFQPRYPHGKSQCYLPGGLMNLGSRLLQAGCQVFFFDLNFTDFKSAEVGRALLRADYIGFSVLGHPYIPEVRANIAYLRMVCDVHVPILIGAVKESQGFRVRISPSGSLPHFSKAVTCKFRFGTTKTLHKRSVCRRSRHRLRPPWLRC